MNEPRDISLINGSTLVLGGARSGKSVFAEKLILESSLKPIYIATSQIWDDEMRGRIDSHIARRGADWICVEAPENITQALADCDPHGGAILVDCLTLWVTNLMMAEADYQVRFDALIAQLRTMKSPVVLVTNEVGLGIVPDNKMAREFRDLAGRLHQQVAAISKQVYFIAAGLPLKMKG